MAIEEGTFLAKDEVRLFYRFQRGSTLTFPLLLVHGHGEHSGRYLKFFTRLEDLGFPLGIFDLRGCGGSGGPRVYVNRFEDYLEDLSSFASFLQERYAAKPPFRLLGHSLGGLIALAWAKAHPEQIHELLLSSPLLGIPREKSLRILAQFLNRFLPRWVLKNPVQPFWLTHDPEEVKRYREDPLIQRKITVRLAFEMLRYAALMRKEGMEAPFPLTILMAEEDYVVDPRATREFYQCLQAPEKKLEVFDGFFHEIFNERGQEKVFERLRFYLGR